MSESNDDREMRYWKITAIVVMITGLGLGIWFHWFSEPCDPEVLSQAYYDACQERLWGMEWIGLMSAFGLTVWAISSLVRKR